MMIRILNSTKLKEKQRLIGMFSAKGKASELKYFSQKDPNVCLGVFKPVVFTL